ncbi:unnamed protein product [Discula destructiva]
MSSIYTLPDSQEPPPSYAEIADEHGAPADRSQEKDRLSDDHLEADHDVAPTSQNPPPFSVTPGTIVIAPQSVLIRCPVSGARPLYQILTPLNGHASSNYLIDMPATRHLKEDGTLKTIRERDQLYRLQRPRIIETSRVGQDTRSVTVSGQHSNQFSGVMLRKDVALGLAGIKCCFEASSTDEDGRARTLYHARQKKGVWEWHDGGGTLVAIEPTPAVNRHLEEDSLEILVPLDKRNLDLIVALWVARLYQCSQAAGELEDKDAAKQRKAAQKELDRQDGRPHGVLHDVKEALGVGYGVKPMTLAMKAFATTKDNGRINWG